MAKPGAGTMNWWVWKLSANQFSIRAVRGIHGLAGLDFFEQVARRPNYFLELIGNIAALEVIAVLLTAFAVPGDLGQGEGHPREFLRTGPMDAAFVRARADWSEAAIVTIRAFGSGRMVGRAEPRFT